MFRLRKFVFDDAAKQAFLDQFEKNGLIAKSARFIGTHSKIVKQAVKDDPEFAEAFEEALELYLESLEAEIHRRGTLGIKEPVFYKGIKVASKKVYSDQLLVFQAKAKIEKYADRSKQDVHITGGVLVAAAPAANAQEWIAAQEAHKQLPAPSSSEEIDERIIIDVGSRETVPD